MALDAFTPSRRGTLGVELELQLVAPTDFDLVPASPDMLALLVRRPFPGTVTPEITQSMIEIATGIHESHATLAAELIQMRDALVAAGDRLNVGVCGGGTHPFQHWTERRIFEKPRFERVSALYGYLTRQFTVFGQHVHLGCADGDEALFLLHALNRYVPHFIALAASSPFVQGTDTLFDSSRLNAISAFPLSGRAPFLMSWKEFETRYFDRMAHTGIVASMKDFYWDIRPKPEYGTIELRVCDTPLTVERAAAIAAYLQALCAHLLEREAPDPVEDDYLVYTHNRFQACRFGLEGVLVHPRTYERVTIRDDILATLDRVRPNAAALGSLGALDELRMIALAGNDAAELRRARAERGAIENVVATALQRFRESSPIT